MKCTRSCGKDLALDVLGHSALTDGSAAESATGAMRSGARSTDIALDVLGHSALTIVIVAEGAGAAALRSNSTVWLTSAAAARTLPWTSSGTVH